MALMSCTNLAYSTVATAPSPASSGTTLTLSSGDGSKFPASNFMVTVWPIGVQPSTTNAEIVFVFSRSGDQFTVLIRAQEGTSARTIGVGDQVALTITAKYLTDIENAALRLDGTVNTVTEGSGFVTATGTVAPTLRLWIDNGAAMVAGNTLGSSAYCGAKDTAHALGVGATVQGVAEETWSTSSSGSRLELNTTNSGATTGTRRLAIDMAGTLHVTPTITSGRVSGANAAIKSDGSAFLGGGLTYSANQPTGANFHIDASGNVDLAGTLTITDKDVVLGTTTGTKFGTAITQKLGFYNATPVAQRANANQAAAPAGGTGATAGAYDTAAHRDAHIALTNEIRTVLVNLGLMKGSA